MLLNSVVLTRKAKKQIKTVPPYIVLKLFDWSRQVENYGLESVRKVKGFHDEPLKGDWKGFRSIRLSKSYRAIYKVKSERKIEFVGVEEVNKHAY